MNGEIDLVTGTSIQSKFLKSSSCRSNVQNSTLHLKSPESNLFPPIVNRKGEVPSSDFSPSHVTSENNNISSEVYDVNRKESDLPRSNISNSNSVIQPIGSGQPRSMVLASELNSNICNTEETNGSHFRSLVTSDHADIKSMSCNELIDFSKLSEDQVQFSDCDFRNKLAKPHTNSGLDSVLDTNITRCNNINTDYMFSRVTSEPDGVQKPYQKGEAKNISMTDPENECTNEHIGSNNIWNHPNCLGTASVDHNLNFVNDSLQSLISGAVIDDVANANDVHANGISSPGSTSAAAKRAITGAHQMSRFPSANKTAAWTNNPTNGVSSSSLGYLVCNAWNVNGNNANTSAKVGAGPCGDSNLNSIANMGNNDSSQLSWPQSTQSQISRLNSQSVSNMLSSATYSNSNSTNNYLTRTPVCLGNTQISSTNMNASNSNKALGETGFTNIYSMFPKRPQHRMMAHWQQQQQHHHPSSQQQQTQFSKNFMNPTNNTLQPNVNRINSGTVSSNLSNIPGGCGDNSVLNVTGNFNGGCSVLQSMSNTVTSANPLILGSSGDSFTSYGLTCSENSSIDNFKYGIDQQLMEVIKSFELTNISGPQTTISTNNNTNAISHIGGLDDLSFGEIDPQLPALSTVTQLPCSVSNPVGIASGTNIHNSGFGGISVLGSTGMTNPYSVFANVFTREEGYSRKVFVGGLPPDIDEEEITTAFRRFGPLIVDWPHKTESKAYFPPKGYCFLLFQEERSVQSLINACIVDENKYYWCVSSPTMKDKPVQIRPWNLADSDFVMDGSQPLDPRKTIFVGGVPRPLRAIELALIMDRLYGGVCYAGIDTDPELKYPKGAGRVAFSNQQSYIAAISARFVQLQHNEIDKRVEVKPYVLDNQMCDECQGTRCSGKFAPFFCANVTCLQYYCEQCWVQIHSRYGREYHKPLVKEGAERPRPALYRW